MKSHLSHLILLILAITLAVACRTLVAKGADFVYANASDKPASASTIKVYFVSGMFSVTQRQAIWDAMEHWKASRKLPGQEIRFIDFGETSGLIDCQNCLTVVREETHSGDSKRRSSFNRLRQDQTGRLLSAWIGIDSKATTTPVLRDLMLKALKRGFEV